MRRYWVFIRLDPDNVYRAHCPDFPDCTGSGESFELALRDVSQALNDRAMRLRQADRPLPRSRSRRALRADGVEAAFLPDLVLAVRVEVAERPRASLSLAV